MSWTPLPKSPDSRDNLNGMGHNPADPIPEPPVEPVPIPGPFA